MDLSKFHDGQRYQFLIDFYPIPYTYNRKIEIRQYVKSLSKDEIVEKCRELSDDKMPVYSIKEGEQPKVKKYKNYNKTLELYTGNNRPNDFYEGRCHQFIIDSSKHDPNLFDDIVSEAQSIWCTILSRSHQIEGTLYNIKCCDYCSEWIYNNHRCSCGNVKICLYVETLCITLDDIDIAVYPQAG